MVELPVRVELYLIIILQADKIKNISLSTKFRQEMDIGQWHFLSLYTFYFTNDLLTLINHKLIFSCPISESLKISDISYDIHTYTIYNHIYIYIYRCGNQIVAKLFFTKKQHKMHILIFCMKKSKLCETYIHIYIYDYI